MHHEALRTTLSATLPCGCEVSREIETHDASLPWSEQLTRQASIVASKLSRQINNHTCETTK